MRYFFSNAAIIVSACAFCFVTSCKPRSFNESETKNTTGLTSTETLTCRSTETRAVAKICLSKNFVLNRSAPAEALVTEVLTRGAVDCASGQHIRALDFIVDGSSIVLQSDNEVLASTPRNSMIEGELTRLHVLPRGSCEEAFTTKLVARSKNKDEEMFFREADGSLPGLLFRGVGFSDDLVAQILSVQPQHVLSTWAYFNLQSALPVERRASTLSGLMIRETLFQSLVKSLEPENPTMAMVALTILQSEAITKTLVGTNRTNITSRAVSASSIFGQAYDYALMNVTKEKVGLVLVYKNTQGRNLYVLENEWETFSHVPKSEQVEAYLLFPTGEEMKRDEQNGTSFYVYKSYELARVTGIGRGRVEDLKISKCTPYRGLYSNNKADKKLLPVCQSEFPLSQVASQDFSERLKKLVGKMLSL